MGFLFKVTKMNIEAIIKALMPLTKLTPFKIILVTLCIIFCWVIYNATPALNSYISVVLEHQVNEAQPLRVTVSPDKIDKINRSFKMYVGNNPQIAMITAFEFVPSNDDFYQGRMLVTSVTANPDIKVEDYNIKWLPISAFRAQINKIINNEIYTESIFTILHDKLVIDNKINRADYVSPINFNLMYSNGIRYMVSVPIMSTNVVGLVTVYYTNEPKTEAEKVAQIEIAKSISVDIGYYISF